MEQAVKRGNMSKLFQVLALSMVFAVVGIYASQFIPYQYFIPLVVLEIITLVLTMVMKKRTGLGYLTMCAFFLISGATTGFSINIYVSTLGGNIVLQAFILTLAAFTGAGAYAYFSKANFSYLQGYLFGGLFLLLIAGVLRLFVPFTGVMELGYSCLGILIYLGYALYDINKIAREGFEEEDIPSIAIDLWLDFIGLFLYILRLFAYFTSSDD